MARGKQYVWENEPMILIVVMEKSISLNDTTHRQVHSKDLPDLVTEDLRWWPRDTSLVLVDTVLYRWLAFPLIFKRQRRKR